MITRVTLTNFQAHKHLVVDCGPLTTLTGGSNGGKSAVLRAILGLIRNDSATDYVRHSQKELSVKLEFDDGHHVEWRKGSGTNKYILTLPTGEVQEFDKVGTDVPDEVRDVLKLGPIVTKTGEKEFVNVHSQLEAPFLISSTPGTVAKIFGELTSASQLYGAVNEGNKQVRSTNSLRTTRKKDLKAVNDSFGEFANLETLEAALEVARIKLASAEQVHKDCQALESILLNNAINEQGIIEHSQNVDAYKEIAAIDLDRLEDVAHTLEALEDYVNSYRELSADMSVADAAAKRLAPLTAIDLDDLQRAETNIYVLNQLVDNINAVKSTEVSTSAVVDTRQQLVADLEERIKSAMSELDSCPQCGQELDEEAKTLLVDGEVVHGTC